MTAEQLWNWCAAMWLRSYGLGEFPTRYASQLSFHVAKLKFTRIYEYGAHCDIVRYHIMVPSHSIVVEKHWSSFSDEAAFIWVSEPTEYELAELILLLPSNSL